VTRPRRAANRATKTGGCASSAKRVTASRKRCSFPPAATSPPATAAADVSLQRSFSVSSKETLNFGAAARDPLMISLGSDAGTLSGATVQFDIDNDGKKNTLPVPKNGGWLALDRNGNGKIDQQNELFGPQSGNGFGELAALDSDGNGAIDEGDPLFARLQLWQGQQDGQDQLTSLMDVGIGALLLPHVDAEFRHTDAANHTVAQMRKAGVYLTESGQAGLISQLDLTA